MSGPGHGHSTGHHKLVQEPDKIATGTVIGVGVGSLLLFAVGIVATYGFLRALGPAVEPLEGSRLVGQAEVGLVNQLPFKTDLRFYEKRDQEMKQLAGYGWVDRKGGLVHIPIEHAMELVAEGVRPPPGPKDAVPRARESDVAKSNWPSAGVTLPVPPGAPPTGTAPAAAPGVEPKPAPGAATPALTPEGVPPLPPTPVPPAGSPAPEGATPAPEGAAPPAGAPAAAEGVQKAAAEGEKKAEEKGPEKAAEKPAEGETKPEGKQPE